MLPLIASTGTRDLDDHPAVLRRYSVDSVVEDRRPFYVLQAAGDGDDSPRIANAVDVRPEKVLHPKVPMEKVLAMIEAAKQAESKEVQAKANTDSNSTTEPPADGPAGVSSKKNVRVRSKIATNPLTQEGLIRCRDRSTLWFKRGALRKVREERLLIVRETRTGILFYEFEGSERGVEAGDDVPAESAEPAEVQAKEDEQANAKQEAHQGRDFRQDSVADTAPVDWTNPGWIDMTDLLTRRACFVVVVDFFNTHRKLMPTLLFMLH